jgi:hypothetical protein
MFSDGGFHPGDGGLRRADPFRQFGLRETGFRARFQDFVQQLEFLREIVVLVANPGLCRARILRKDDAQILFRQTYSPR